LSTPFHEVAGCGVGLNVPVKLEQLDVHA